MRKILLSLLIGSSFVGSAQNLEIRDAGGALLNNTTVTHIGSPSDFEIVAENYFVYNVGASSVSVKCKRIEETVITGTASALCWTVCSMDYAAGTMPVLIAPSSAQTISSGGSCSLFVLHYKPQGNSGISSFRVVFYNTVDANDTASFTVNFDATLSVNETLAKSASISAYPNPANNTVNIDIADFNEKATLRITDALGITVKTAQVNGETNLKFSTADLREGVYFYSLITNNKAVLTRRLVITR